MAVATRPTALCQDVPASTQSVLLAASAAASIGRQSMGCCMWRQSVGYWMWYGCQLAVWWSAAARNARRRPKKAKKAMEAQCQSIKCVLLLCRFRSCDSSAAIPERSPTPLHYPLASPARVMCSFSFRLRLFMVVYLRDGIPSGAAVAKTPATRGATSPARHGPYLLVRVPVPRT